LEKRKWRALDLSDVEDQAFDIGCASALMVENNSGQENSE
jgi:hypothetical protein